MSDAQEQILKSSETFTFTRQWNSNLLGFHLQGNVFVESILVAGEPRPICTLGPSLYKLGSMMPLADIEVTVRCFGRGFTTATIFWLDSQDESQPGTEPGLLTHKQSSMGAVSAPGFLGATQHVPAFTSPVVPISTGGAIQQVEFSVGQVGESVSGMPSPEIRYVPEVPANRQVGSLTEPMVMGTGGYTQVTDFPGQSSGHPSLAEQCVNVSVVMTSSLRRVFEAWINTGIDLAVHEKAALKRVVNQSLATTYSGFPGSSVTLTRTRAEQLLRELEK